MLDRIRQRAGDLDGAGLAGILSLAAQKSPAQGNIVQVSSSSLFRLGETAPAGSSTADQASLDAADRGLIDLTGTVPITTAATDGSDASVVQDANGFRPQSSVGLYCDMEVARSGRRANGRKPCRIWLPKLRLAPQSSKLKAPAGRPPFARCSSGADSRQRASVTLGDGATLLMGTVLVVLMDRMRLEPVNSDRQRPLREVGRS